jgi:TolB-like protein/DNA-binding winged helix-turn-helix (wHTH) protein/Flp pilus assembly protein TadD
MRSRSRGAAVPSEQASSAGLLKFGEDFEFDSRAYKLSRAGRALKLERIPLEVLSILLDQRGQIVGRDDIVERIWGKGVFLDTDNSINGAIRKIRQALKDDPEQPRFIQTITGKGYRFIAPVVVPAAEAEAEPTMAVATPTLREAPAEAALRRRPIWSFALATFTAIVLVVVVSAYFRWFAPTSTSRPLLSGGRTMLAVLPFQNLTGDASQEYFSDGMTEEMIAQLGSIDPDHLGIIARTSVMHYKDSREPLQQIARELGVQYVLEGSVRRDAGKIRIAAQLIQMRDQTHLWSHQYDRETKDLLVVQSEIAHEISDELQSSLGGRNPIAPATRPILSPEAYEAYNLYLKGQYFWNKRTSDGLEQAIDYFQQAVAKDPADARAFAGLADSYALIGMYRGMPSGETTRRARAAAVRALQLDDKLPEAHTALALIVQNYDYDWQTAEKEFKRAIELNPNYATGHHWYAEHLAWRGRFDEALRESERARELDPLSLIIASDNGAILYYSRQYDKAIAQFKSVREMDPNFWRSSVIFEAYVQKGMFAEAEALVEKASSTPWGFSDLAYTYGRAGKQHEAEQVLQKLLDLNRRGSVDPAVIAMACIGTGNADQAMAWLEKAYAQHSNALTGLKVDPIYDPLRGDARFQSLLRRVGLGE